MEVLVGKLETRVDAIEGYQDKQNGHIDTLVSDFAQFRKDVFNWFLGLLMVIMVFLVGTVGTTWWALANHMAGNVP